MQAARQAGFESTEEHHYHCPFGSDAQQEAQDLSPTSLVSSNAISCTTHVDPLFSVGFGVQVLGTDSASGLSPERAGRAR